MATTRLMTVEDFLLLDDDRKYELNEGVLTEVPPASEEHGGVAHNVVNEVGATPGSRSLVKGYIADAPFLLARDPDDVVVPDAAFVLRSRLPPKGERGRVLQIPPDIAVEVVSPSDRRPDIMNKVMRYIDAGTQVVWLIDPMTRTVTVFGPDRQGIVLEESDTLTATDIIPGLAIPVAALFAD